LKSWQSHKYSIALISIILLIVMIKTLSTHHLATNYPMLQRFWASDFAPRTSLLDFLIFTKDKLKNLLYIYFDKQFLLISLFIFGLITCHRIHWRLGLSWLIPAGLMLVVSLFGIYAFWVNRLSLVLLSFLFIIAGYGFTWLVERIAYKPNLIGGTLIAMMMT